MNRLELTRRLVQELDQDIELNQAISDWWWDMRPRGGLRLSDAGWEVLVNTIDIEHWRFDIADSVLTPRNLLALDRFMTCPYYLKKQRRQCTLILFGNRESTMAMLYGDVERFLASLEH